MPAVTTSKLGQFALITLSITGASLLTANILSSSFTKTSKAITNSSNFLTLSESFSPSRDTVETQSPTSNDLPNDTTSSLSAPERQISQTQHKKCKVVITSTDENYKVVACDENGNSIRRSEVWYLFDNKNSSLERIDGLTSTNDFDWRPVDNTELWKNKKWRGYRGRHSRRTWGKELVGSDFELKYVFNENSFKFPFYRYLSVFCQHGKTIRGYKGLQFPSSSCAYFDIPLNHFRTINLIKPYLSNAFGPEQEKCFTGTTNETELTVNNEQKRVMKWKEEENCNFHSSKK